MEKIKECYEEGIVAIIPTYIDMYGDGTKILTGKRNEHLIDKNIKRVLNILAKKEFLDLKESKRYYGEKLGCKNLVPIPLNEEAILIPIKTRKAINKNDSSFAYINLKDIEEILEDDKEGIIILKDRREIITRQRLCTIEKHIRNGNLLKEIIEAKNKDKQPVIERVLEKDLFREYNSPATKGDILALRNEIMYIKGKIKM